MTTVGRLLTSASPLTTRVARGWRDLPARLRPTSTTIWRLTLAAVVSYVLTRAVTRGPLDLTGALTALLVVQTSATATLRMAAVRIGAVLTGVFSAVLLTAVAGLSWWTLGAIIAAALVLARVLRLGAQSLETPISAMLILGVGGQQIAVETRVIDTLIGAAVGVLLTVLLPPLVPVRGAVSAVRGVAEAEADVLERAAQALAAGPVVRDEVDGWLDDARAIGGDVARASDQVYELKDVRRFNARAVGRRDAEPSLRLGLDALDHVQFATRALFARMLTEAPAAATTGDDGTDAFGDDVRQAFAVVLTDVAGCVRSFGAVLAADAADNGDTAEQRLDESLEIVRETRAILTELLLIDAQADPSRWLLRGTILAAVDEILGQFDVEQRDLRRRRAAGSVPSGAALLRVGSSRLVREMLRPAPVRKVAVGTWWLASSPARVVRAARAGRPARSDRAA